MHQYLEEAAKSFSIELPDLKKAAEIAKNEIDDFKDLLPKILSDEYHIEDHSELENVDVVVLGSIARQESTTGSDCDYFILQNGASPQATQDLIYATEKVRRAIGFSEPGGQGVFGNIVIAANLYESIGLDIDTNANMTRRLLLLTESKSVLSEETYNSVVDNILLRYCSDYLPPIREQGSHAKTPRYLLNDLVRLWRTIAVDFGTKRWRTIKDDSHLRLVKLRITRKILFAGPLATLLLVPNRIKTNDQLKDYLNEWLRLPPIAQLSSTFGELSQKSKEALRNLLINYDRFIGLLGQRNVRDILKKPDVYKERFDHILLECRNIADTIQDSLEIIFFDDSLFKDSFRKYSVF
jgi:hypothetical protein